MKKNKYNDYELLYLISEHSTRALEIMYEKYQPLIKARIKDFNISYSNYEDFYQEGLIVLHMCINRFNDVYNKTFTKYFDLCLQRKIMDLLRKDKRYYYDTVILDNVDFVYEENKCYGEDFVDYDKYLKKLSEFEKNVFKYKYIEQYKINDIAKILNVNVKKVYNALSKIKIKLNEHNNKIK